MPDFPPLLQGRAVSEPPFAAAVAAAQAGCDAGLVLYRPSEAALDAALVLSPEVPLRAAVAMLSAAQVALGDALGALAPPETGVEFEWPAGLRVNGARCGALRAAADVTDAEAVPGWLVVGLTVPFARTGTAEPGQDPENTDLYEEGVRDLTPDRLLESWSRHMLVWIHEWETAGVRRLHAEWRARAWSLGREVTLRLPTGERRGTFVGLDEACGLVLKGEGATDLLPLTAILERP